jgi:hypothetical protein
MPRAKKRPGDDPQRPPRKPAKPSGISNRPVEEEIALQQNLPPRGKRRDERGRERNPNEDDDVPPVD